MLSTLHANVSTLRTVLALDNVRSTNKDVQKIMRRLGPFSMLAAAVIVMLFGCAQQRDGSSQTDATLVPESAVVATPTEPAEELGISAEFIIIPEQSSARFELDENLKSALTGWNRGQRITVVGSTNQITGSFSLSTANLAATQFGELTINAASFTTDNYYRTSAIRRNILQTATYPTISFSPTAIRDLPETADIGDQVNFTLDGDLTIRDVSLAQSFTVSATLVTAQRIVGQASTIVARDDYGLEIRVAPHVTNVEDFVELYIDFVALAASSP